ncbi:hypothetical protein PMKS-002236 [Pichia membranifaciens]|uniref:Synchronized import protein 1 n=1 Tax=Pichia membranifaciens TaxID=4926 RepID=A0A1Q2YH01_9ASCO|nr:hypothetical protein PMKS-002236 [Pichia membranifaciens]
MAKLKKRSKLSQQRHRANQLKNPNGANGKKNDSNKSIKVNSMLDKIKATSTCSVNEKLITINSILVQCNNDEMTRKMFLKNDLVKIVLNDLLKQESQFDEIVVSSLDLLKHLIVEENYDLSIYLWRNGIWDIIYSNITKAFDSLSHLNDSNVDVLSKDLLLSYINNLIGILDNLVMELNLETINGSLIPQLVGSNVLNGLFSLFNFETTSKFNISLSLSVLQFVYDLSSISENFLKDVLLNNTEFKDVFEKLLSNSGTIFGKTPLGRIYLVGIKLQILEIQDDLTSNLDSTLGEIFNILTEIDFNSEKDDEFQIVDISLDLLTTIIEIKGSLLLEDSSNKDKVFISQCTDNILPFLGKLFEVNFKNNKKLICLNNLIIYLKSNNCVNEKLLSDLENLNSNKIANDFTTLLQSSDKSDLDLELLVDFLNFKLNLLEIDPSKFASEETQVNALIELGMKMSSIDVAIDSELQLQFITSLLIYLSLLAKCIENIETTKAIVNFIIRYNITIPFSFYNTQLKSGLNISKFHHKYHYFVEETVTLAINSIFEMFDDDYPYNRPIYHGENLNEILISVLGDYKKLYKNIDKNLNLRLKKQTEETLNNLQRFIEYKKTE